MLLPTRKDWITSLIAATLSVVIFALYLLARFGFSWNAVIERWDQLLAVFLLVGNGAVCALWLLRVRYLQLFQDMTSRLESFRTNPSTSSEPIDGEWTGHHEEVIELTAAVDALCRGYHKALTDRVIQNAALESLRSLLGKVDLEKGLIHGSVRGSTTSRDMVARFTPNLYWLTATPTLQQFLGYQMSELNGRPFIELIHPDDADAVTEAFETAMLTGEAHNIIFRLRIREHAKPVKSTKPERNHVRQSEVNIDLRHVQVDMLTRYNDSGNPLHIRCYLIDITDQVHAQNELRWRTKELSQTNERLRQINLDLQRLKESYRDLYHNAPVMYFSLNAQGQFVTFNNTMLSTLGYSKAELFKKPYDTILTPESRKRFQQRPQAFHKSGEVESQWVKRDGSVMDIWIRNTPLQDQTGAFVRSRSVAQDVTERNRLADELRQRGDELEKANAELRQINNSLDEFTGVVSHDLKEPLRTLESYCHLLSEEYGSQLGDKGAGYLEFLVNSSRRLSGLVKDLLDLSQAGRIIRKPELFDMAELVSTICKDLDDLIRRKNAMVVIEGHLPQVIGDPQRITQLLGNLITNAIKYNDSPAPRVMIGHRSRSQNGPGSLEAVQPVSDNDLSTYYVSDNGIGIDSAYHEQVFGIFRRLHETDRYEGTGAGLAIARKIVEAHSGRIWVESNEGDGSTFYFTLPSRRTADPKHQAQRIIASSRQLIAAEMQDDSHPESEMRDGESEQSRTGIQDGEAAILMVEDMPDIAAIVQRLADKAGYATHWVTSAEAAWDYLQDYQPDLVLLDIHLPGMSGIELCKMVRETPDLDHLTIALFSQLEQPEAKIAGRDAGANYVLSKDLLCHADVWQQKLEDILAECKSKAPV